jgi:signal transduction histidine kinase
MIVASRREDALPGDTEHRLAEFTELVATTIANAQARQELRALADEQAALRRVATLVARGETPSAVFDAVAEVVGRLLGTDVTLIGRYDRDGTVAGVAGWSRSAGTVAVDLRAVVGGRNVTTLVLETGRPARMDDYADASGGAAEGARALGLRSTVGAPISVERSVWGVMVAASTGDEPVPPHTEERLADFTELVATAIANTQAREALRTVVDEQTALRRVATLVASAPEPAAVFATVAEEAGRVLAADVGSLIRFDSDETGTVVAVWDATGRTVPVGDPVALGERGVATRIRETGGPVRIDDLRHGAAQTPAVRELGIRSAVTAPITVGGHLWGTLTIGFTGEDLPPPDAEARLSGFAELVATAIANAEAYTALTESRARIVATADETRRRIERDLHDGAQQRLVSLALRVRAAQAELPPGLDEIAAELDGVAAGLNDALDELRELARGIHPAMLAEGGLRPALKTLARRSPVPVELDTRLERRLAETLEVAAYYVVSEALTNVAKHAEASMVAIDVEAGDEALRISVRDDGAGGANFGRGSGLVGLKDRVEALGGRMGLQSEPGAGTSLTVELPLAEWRSAATAHGWTAKQAEPGSGGREQPSDAPR